MKHDSSALTRPLLLARPGRAFQGGLRVRPTAAVIVAALLTFSLTGCSSMQAMADDRTASIADWALPIALTDAVAAARTPEERVVAAREWLSDSYSTLPGYMPTVWKVRGAEGTTFRVDVYYYWESGDLVPPDQGKSTHGLACRTYDVAAPAVVTTAVECPKGTPTAP